MTADAMTAPIRVFINEHPLDVPAGMDVLAAVGVFDDALADDVAKGTAYVTDGRGIEIAADAPLAGGAILRVVRSVRRSRGDRPTGGDAHA